MMNTQHHNIIRFDDDDLNRVENITIYYMVPTGGGKGVKGKTYSPHNDYYQSKIYIRDFT